MSTRRQFVKSAVVATSVIAGSDSPAKVTTLQSSPSPSGAEDRKYWVGIAARLASPVLDALAHRRLKAEMPVEQRRGAERTSYTYLEAFARLLCGIAPWLENSAHVTDDEGAQRFAELGREGLNAASDFSSPDRMNFSEGAQPLVDAAFLAEAILRAPVELWHKVAARVQRNLIEAIKQTRSIQPPESNWQLFATMIEVFFQFAGEQVDRTRLETGLQKYRNWYLGDGVYGDGPEFHWDYYNSFVIHPMLVDALSALSENQWTEFRERELLRLTRWAAIQERLIAPDGSYPAIGRSITYRCGAFHGLALAALKRALPAEVKPGQARRALTAVIRRTLESPNTWDAKGWLLTGLAGHQPFLGERYISTGSLYLCSAALLPLGLPSTDAFWSESSGVTTWETAWSGRDLPADHALDTK
jgi:hypothetical protein